MSNKTNLVPRLRFPEFQTSGAWRICPLVSTVRITQGGTPNTQIVEYWNGGVPWITPVEMGNVASKYITKTVRTLTTAGLKNCSSELLPAYSLIISTRAPIGHLVINQVPLAINQGCKGLIPDTNIDTNFIYFTLERSKTQLNDIGAGNTFKELSGSVLGAFNIAIPTLQEQRKIADCLSSLDEVIEAQTQKLKVLKKHKKALMQRLFPVVDAGVGERLIPRLRFPEFKNAEAWIAKEIGVISIIMRGQNISKNDLSPDGKNFCIHYGELFTEYNDIINEVFSRTNLDNGLKSKIGDILMPSSDVTPEGLGKASVLLASEVLLGNDMNVIRLKKDLDPRFINYLINFGKQDFISVVSGTTVKHLYARDLARIKITVAVSKQEQRKIADCLSLLDEVIESRDKKIAALKNHKKSLLQQLFPIMQG